MFKYTIFDAMSIEKGTNIRRENILLSSMQLDRPVKVDFYLSAAPQDMRSTSLLLINDGQDLDRLAGKFGRRKF